MFSPLILIPSRISMVLVHWPLTTHLSRIATIRFVCRHEIVMVNKRLYTFKIQVKTYIAITIDEERDEKVLTLLSAC